MEMNKELDDTNLTECNIQKIEEDAQRLKKLKEANKSEDNLIIKEDKDDLSSYTHDDDGVKVLDDTTSINKRAIFHDLNRLKHWRESMEQETSLEKQKDIGGTPIEPILETNTEDILNVMEKNLDGILNQLPDVVSEETNTAEAAQKLEEIESKLQRKYTLDGS